MRNTRSLWSSIVAIGVIIGIIGSCVTIIEFPSFFNGLIQNPGHSPTPGSFPSNTQQQTLTPVGTAAPTYVEDMPIADGTVPSLGLSTIGGQTFHHSLRYMFQAHYSDPQSTIYSLNSRFRHFHATIGLESDQNCFVTSGTCGVKFEVFVNNNVRIYEQMMVFDAKDILVNLDVTNAASLTLIMTPNTTGIIWTKVTAVWGDAIIS